MDALPRQIHNRGKHTINQEFLKSGLHVEMSVILAESWRGFSARHTPILMDDRPPLPTFPPQTCDLR